MKKYFKHSSFKTGASIIVLLLSLWSCNKFVDTPIPSNSIVVENVFSNDNSLTAALDGIYAGVAGSATGSTVFTTAPLLADEMVTSSTSGTPYMAMTNTYTQDNDYGFYAKYYNLIYQTNMILQEIDNAPQISAAVKSQVKGECLFLRAYCYFHLVNFYGTVPLITSTDVNLINYQTNTPVATTYQMIIADLKTAAGLLSDTYPSKTAPLTGQPAIRTRANKQTVNALLAKAYLYTSDWTNADATATLVINSGLYSLPSSPKAVFANTSTETIWQFWNGTGITVGGSFVPTDTLNTLSLTYRVRPELVSTFSTSDLRYKTWMKLGTGAFATTYYPYKYRVKVASATRSEFLIQFRLAEMYLIRAEALGHETVANNVANGILDLDIIRRRAGLTTPSTGIATSADLLTAVAMERRKELMFEDANRWFDINRTGQTVAALSAVAKIGITDNHIAILPFPRPSTVADPNLVQNPGYN